MINKLIESALKFSGLVSIALILVIGLIFSGFRWRVRAIEAHRQQLEIQVEERTRELSAKTERSFISP